MNTMQVFLLWACFLSPVLDVGILSGMEKSHSFSRSPIDLLPIEMKEYIVFSILKASLAQSATPLWPGVRTIVNFGATCHHLYEITHNKKLWNPYLLDLIKEKKGDIAALAPFFIASPKNNIGQALAVYLDNYNTQEPLSKHPRIENFSTTTTPLTNKSHKFFNLFTLALQKPNYLRPEQKKVLFTKGVVEINLPGAAYSYDSQENIILLLHTLFSQKNNEDISDLLAIPKFSPPHLLPLNAAGETHLIRACREKNKHEVKRILENTHNKQKRQKLLCHQDVLGMDALMCTICQGNRAIFKLLLNDKAPIDQEDVIGHTPFILALKYHNRPAIKGLVRYLKTSIKKKKKKEKPYIHAPKKNLSKKLQSLLPHVVLFNQPENYPKKILCHQDQGGYSVLAWAAFTGRLDIFTLIFDCYKKYLREITADDYASALNISARCDFPTIVNFLVECKTPYAPRSLTFAHPFIAAAQCGSYDVVNLFLHQQSGCITEDDHMEAIIVSYERGHFPIVKLLLECHPPIAESRKRYHKQHPALVAMLGSAAKQGDSRIIQYLVNQCSFSAYEICITAALASENDHDDLAQDLLSQEHYQDFYKQQLPRIAWLRKCAKQYEEY